MHQGFFACAIASAPPDLRAAGPSTERWIDDELTQSFPASDAPSWTMGVEQPEGHGPVAPGGWAP